MTLLVWLVFAHILADFYIRPKASAADRAGHGESESVWWHALLKHGLVYGFLLVLVLLLAVALGQLTRLGPAMLALSMFVASYVLIDWAKTCFKPSATALLLKQMAHLVALVLIWAWLTGFTPFIAAWSHSMLLQRPLWILLSVYLLAARPCSFFVALVLQKQAKALAANERNQGLIEAGRLIGYVERWLIVSFIVTGQFIGVGFLLAAKSIFRFGDLSQAHERRLTEYMLLGTLVSFASAMALGALALYLT